MSAKTFAFAAGSAQRIRKIFADDSGGVVRKIKKMYASDSGGVTRLVFIADDELSMLVGTGANSNGYASGGFGTLTPSTLGDGAVIDEITFTNHSAPVSGNALLFLNSYPGTITAAYLTSITVGGVTLTPSDVNFTGFSGGAPGGSAQWTWSGAGFPTPGTTIPVVIVRT